MHWFVVKNGAVIGTEIPKYKKYLQKYFKYDTYPGKDRVIYQNKSTSTGFDESVKPKFTQSRKV
jgi:hypothetical protein